jgi:steroid delta-isomerase-like uncharacterized protein
MMSDNNQAKRIVHRFVEEFQSLGNEAVADDLLASSMVDHTPMDGFSSGPDGVKVLMRLLRAGMPDMYAVIHDQVAEGNKVVTRKSFRGTHQNELFGVPATGRPISIEVIDIVRVENGQIAEHWNVVDQLGLMQQMGVLPAG